MPTVLRIGSLRFHFYSDERGEPPHYMLQHQRRCSSGCLRLARNIGVPPRTVREIEKLVFQHQKLLVEKYNAWHS